MTPEQKAKDQFQKDMEFIQKSLNRAFNPTPFQKFIDDYFNIFSVLLYTLIFAIGYLFYLILN